MTDVLLLALPQSFASGVIGARDLLTVESRFLRDPAAGMPHETGFRTRLVAETARVEMMLGTNTDADCLIGRCETADVVYVPPIAAIPGQPLELSADLLEWLRKQYAGGALLCSACTGSLILAATGLLDGLSATTHWAYVDDMRRQYPDVDVQANRTLVAGGNKQRLVTAGGYASWHDLMLYLIHRFAGAEAARTVARFFLLDWHDVDQQAYACFRENLQHNDETIRAAQQWLREHVGHCAPVEAAIEHSGLSQRSFLRRFKRSTGHTPLRYLQHLRVEHAKNLLECSDASIDDIAWQVGYEDATYFRRMFRRFTSLTPSNYRKTFRTPANVVALLD